MFRSANQIIDDFYRHFMSIYAFWDERHSAALARKMIEQDIVILGLSMGTIDEFGQLTELTLLAECIAYVRMFDSTIDRRVMIDYWMDVVMEDLLLNHVPLLPQKQNSYDIVEQLKTWELTKDLLELGRIDPASALQLRHSFLEIADLFIMRNGNISNAEMEAMREFEKSLTLD